VALPAALPTAAKVPELEAVAVDVPAALPTLATVLAPTPATVEDPAAVPVDVPLSVMAKTVATPAALPTA
jgi:hypothetical protein